MIDRLFEGDQVSEERTIDLITVSREFGSGGSDLARRLGALLDWSVLDHDLVHRVAERLHLEPEHVEAMDEKCPSLLTRFISSALLMTPPEMTVDAETREMLHPDAVAEAARAAILAAAHTPPLIVVGHGSQCLFHSRPRTLHVRLVAPLEDRVRRLCARIPCDPSAAAAAARRMDTARGAYVRRHYHADWRNPMLYDLEFNTGRVSVVTAAAAILEVLGPREPAANRYS